MYWLSLSKPPDPPKKLSEKFLGPFEVIGKPSSHSYQVKLPAHLQSIHPVFHISQLEPTSPSSIEGRYNPPPSPIEVEGDIEYEIAQVLDSKLDHRRKSPLLYYVQWAGYEGTDDEFSWLGANELNHALELVQEFHEQYPQKPGLCHLISQGHEGMAMRGGHCHNPVTARSHTSLMPSS